MGVIPDLQSVPANGQLAFARSWNADAIDALSVATDEAGNIVLAGRFVHKADFGSGEVTGQGDSFDSFVTKLDPQGRPLWTRTYFCAANDQPIALAIDGTGSIVVTGHFVGSLDVGTGPLSGSKDGHFAMYVVRYAADGTLMWARSFPTLDGGSVFPRHLAVDGSNNILIAGEFGMKIDFGGGVLDSGGSDTALVLKLSPSGGHLFSRMVADPRSFRGEALHVAGTHDSDVLVSGGVYGNASGVDFGGGPVPVVGTRRQAYFVRYSPTGLFKSARIVGSDPNATAKGRSVSFYKNGDILLSGDYDGPLDCGGGPLSAGPGTAAFIARYTGSGDHLWSKGFRSPAGGVQAQSHAIDSTGRAVVVGTFSGVVSFGGATFTAQGGSDLFMLKIDGDGSHLWSRAYGSLTQSDYGFDVAIDRSDAVITIGSYSGTIDVGGSPFTSGQGGRGPGMLLLKHAP